MNVFACVLKYIKIPIEIETLEIQTEDDLEDGEYEAIEIIRPLELPMKM